jgi:hypothetical protein
MPPPPKQTNSEKPALRGDADLARALGVTRQAIATHRKRNKDAPQGLDIGAWKAFLAAKGREGSTPEAVHMQIALRKLSILASKDEKDKDDLALSRKNLIKWQDMQHIVAKLIMGLYWGGFDRFIQEWPPKLAGLTPQQIHTYLRKDKERLARQMNEAVAEFMKNFSPGSKAND